MSLFTVTGLVLITLPLAFNLLFFMLGRSFEYPDILRRPTDHILTRFLAGGPRLVALWYAFAMTALLAIPMALLMQQIFMATQPELAAASGILGVLSGLLQAMGLLRWPLLVPLLATQYQQASSESERQSVALIFNALHQYAGVVIGEHMGFFFTAAWSILLGIMMIGSPIFGATLGIFGIVSAIGILAGLLEPAGWKTAAAINAISYILWSLWLIASGIALLLA